MAGLERDVRNLKRRQQVPKNHPYPGDPSEGADAAVIDSTENVGDAWGVHSAGPETEGWVLTADGTGGSAWAEAPGDGGGGGTGIFFNTDPQADDYLVITATGEGTGYAAGEMALECNGGTTWLQNTDEGVVVYSTGRFTAGRITDLATAVLETGASRPGMIIAAEQGLIISQAAIDSQAEHGTLNLVFLYADTGNNLLRSPVILATTSDPHVAGALWNDGGTVKISSG
jgi:hypothetical protein